MLSVTNRFRGRGSLNATYKHGQSVHGPLIMLRYSKNPRRKVFRAAVVVSKKVDKSAVKRNRLRRQIYESLRASSSHINEPYDLVFTVMTSDVQNLTPGELNKLIKDRLTRAGVLK